MKQLLETVNEIHKENIVHLDIKSCNILVDKEDNLVLADFGLAELASSLNISDG